MGFMDSIKNMFGGAKDAAGDAGQKTGDLLEQGKQWVQDQGGGEGLQQKAGDLIEQAKDAAANIDIPGTDLDDRLKEKLSIDKK